ncbi:MAG: hypothetical protein ACI9XK_004660 [Granulosicoccus sp.]
MDAIKTRSKRLLTIDKLSSTVTLAMNEHIPANY